MLPRIFRPQEDIFLCTFERVLAYAPLFKSCGRRCSTHPANTHTRSFAFSFFFFDERPGKSHVRARPWEHIKRRFVFFNNSTVEKEKNTNAISSAAAARTVNVLGKRERKEEEEEEEEVKKIG